jgi:hypothetical protein
MEQAGDGEGKPLGGERVMEHVAPKAMVEILNEIIEMHQ